MNLAEMLAKAKKVSKKDDIPGSIDHVLEERCPACKRHMKLYKPCCGSTNGYKGCNCGYKINL